jgi:hypothetical protein
LRAISSVSHGDKVTPRLACLMIDEAPTTSRALSWRFPCLEIDPSFSFPPLESKTRGKAQPGREVAAGFEALNVVDSRPNSGGDQRADAGDARQAPSGFIGFDPHLDFLVQMLDAIREHDALIRHFEQSPDWRQRNVGIAHLIGELGNACQS